ncbi:hypothetical protein F4824DRAFT_499102 [Ustulina deusta]|nr:hypothetical protein F4824DRAFT_499102 [Ustulina deusta]
MLGGGLGRLEGLHDLTSDALLSVRMITWDVTFIQASRTVNDNLFWGIRGAGQNFDVIVEALFETYPATNWCMHSLLIPNLDPRLAIATAIAPNPTTLEPTVRVNIIYPGPLEKGQTFRKLYSPLSSSFAEQMVG